MLKPLCIPVYRGDDDDDDDDDRGASLPLSLHLGGVDAETIRPR